MCERQAEVSTPRAVRMLDWNGPGRVMTCRSLSFAVEPFTKERLGGPSAIRQPRPVRSPARPSCAVVAARS